MIKLNFNKIVLILAFSIWNISANSVNLDNIHKNRSTEHNLNNFRIQSKNELIEELNQNPIDPNSFSRSDLSIVTDILWNVTVNFDRKSISGFVELIIEKKKPFVDELILDSSNLTIYHVIDKDSNEKLQFYLSEYIDVFGSKLSIKLPEQNVSTVKIFYETSPYAKALQWLKPEHIAGKKSPYLFSQCSSIYCRAMLPIQDTPSVKAPYKAVIRAPKDLVVLLSAIHDGQSLLNEEMKEFRFTQSIPIPSYLFAIAVGSLVSRKIGPRSSVWSERELIDSAAYDFADTEKMISFAESLFGPYVWGVYDLLVLPQSFPYGGMENPCITFVSPSIITGDRSLSSVIAHEISHSWTGNVVSIRNFQHYWIKEALTMCVERKIGGQLYGKELGRDLHAIEGLKNLKYDVNRMGNSHPFTKLVIDLRGINPQNTYTSVPYEKGYTFIVYLEQILGGPKVFEPFLFAFIEKFKFKSVDSDDLKVYLYDYFKNQTNILDTVDWDQWFYCTGMPPVIPKYDTSIYESINSFANQWINANDSELQIKFDRNDLKNMSAKQISIFLSILLETEPPLSELKVQTIVDLYNLNATNNSDIRAEWIRLGLRSHWKGCINDTIQFVSYSGRISHLRPIFSGLNLWEETRDLGIALYNSNKEKWMYMTRSAIAQVLNVPE